MRRFLLAAGLAALAAAGVQAQSLATNLNAVANGSAPTGHIAWPAANPVWEFDFYRNGNTTLPDGSGIEIRNVTYLGRKVFDRAHVPVLNVEYSTGGCGCYRDWQDSESPYETRTAPGGVANTYYTDAVAGSVITNCERRTAPANDGGNGGAIFNDPDDRPQPDAGTFRGTSVEDYGNELVLTGLGRAGWYRYRMKWHFYSDGRIWPEYSFASAPNSCTARPRRHHAYWRFDFDLENTPSNDVVSETAMDGTVTTFATEVRRNWGTTVGTAAPTRTVDHWAVTDATTQAGFTLTPGSDDLLIGTDAFSKADALVVQYHTNEIYDGIQFGGGCAFAFEPWLNNESVNGADNVFWYRSSSARTTGRCELVGPTLRPFGYVATGAEETPAGLAPVEVQAATPNPYTSQTTVRFRMAESQDVRVVLYDALGRQVRVLLSQPVEAGMYETVEIQSGDLPSGTYVVRVEGARASGSTRIVLTR